MPHHCKSVGCHLPVEPNKDFCGLCENRELPGSAGESLADRYPEQYKSVGDLTEVDVYAVHHLFQIPDPSGCLQHASRLLLTAGNSTYSNQTVQFNVREARDVLNRWLQLNKELAHT